MDVRCSPINRHRRRNDQCRSQKLKQKIAPMSVTEFSELTLVNCNVSTAVLTYSAPTFFRLNSYLTEVNIYSVVFNDNVG